MEKLPHATEYHTPVMVHEVLGHLAATPGKWFVDGTAGGGGHTEALLNATAPDGRVLALDRDPRAVEEVRRRLSAEIESGRLIVVEANYSEAADVLRQQGWEKVDGFLVDAGVSSHQLDEADRGFSFQAPGPLDMRMGQSGTTVADLIDESGEEELAAILREGEVRKSRRIARKILEVRADGELNTTEDLADAVVAVVGNPPWQSIHPATLVFQALRIAVNRELDHLEVAVKSIPDVVRDGGHAVFISFHSLEDRIVKHGMRRLEDPCECPKNLPECVCGKLPAGKVITKRPVCAGPDEVDVNPRARSAKLRAFLCGQP